MVVIKKGLIIGILCSLVSGCSGYSSKFTCPVDNGIPCTSSMKVLKMTQEGSLPKGHTGQNFPKKNTKTTLRSVWLPEQKQFKLTSVEN